MEKDTDKILDVWEKSLFKLSENLKARNIAEVNYDSIFCKVLVEVREESGLTIAEKVTKGSPEVLVAKAELLEAERLVKAGIEKIRFLEAQLNAIKLQERLTARVV